MTENIVNFEAIEEKLGDSKVEGVFNFLGSRVGRGKELFVQIDKTYVLASCDFAIKRKALLFSHVTSKGGSPTSWIYYFKIKGEVEQELKNNEMANVSIFKPGLIKDRANDARCGEKVFGCVPFIDKISSKELAKKILIEAEGRIPNLRNGEGEGTKVYEHSAINKI